MALSSVIVGATPAHAKVNVIQVTNTNDSGAGSLREALAEAQATDTDDEITFAPSVTGTIRLTTGELDVAVGGAAGNLTVQGPGPDVVAVDAGGQSRVLDVHGPGGDTRPLVVVSGLTLTGGFTAGAVDGGGALRAMGTDVTLARMLVSDSRTYGFGGGVSLEGGSLLVTASTITGNSSWVTSWGGGYGAGGGGIFFDGGETTGTALAVHDSTISDNTAYSRGGGIHSQSPASVTVTGSTVSDNTAAFTWRGMEAAGVVGDGGGISASHITVVDSRITGNEAGQYGGGLSGSSVVVTGSTIADNVAGEQGGGIRVKGVQAEYGLRLKSSTVTGNRADDGGGLHVVSDVPVEVTLSTVAANTAVTGGGLHSNTHVALQGTIVAMNAGGDLAGAGSATLAQSLVQDPRGFSYVDSGGSIIGKDPLLSPLVDHGGPTETMVPASNSPVIDAGSGFGATTDQRGFPRPVDDADTPNAVDGADIGAIELTEAELAGLPQVGNTTQPTIAGRARVGETLHTDGGTWSPEDVSLNYQWLRDNVPISGATSASYTLTAEDFGRLWYGEDLRKRVSVQVTAAAVGFRDGSVMSDYTRPVAKGVIVVSRPAQVTGKVRVGSILRARPHVRGISPRRPFVTIMWYLDDRNVGSAYNEQRFELKSRMRGKRVEVRFVYAPPRGYKQLTQVVAKRRRVR